jgi:hypothetical protein
MPNVWTHILYGEKVLFNVNKTYLTKEEMPYFRLGTQGPDPFFYHNFWPWKEKPVTEIGLKLHYEQCGPFLIELIKQAKHTNDLKLRAYVLGFITHHLLDRNTHPYIHYRAGYKGNNHQKLEIIIDTLLMKHYRNIETWKTPVYKQIDHGKTLYGPIESTLKNTINMFFRETVRKLPKDFIDKSYRDMKLALRVLFDPLGWKNKLLKEKVSSFSYQKCVDNKDFLNQNKKNWYHPAVKDEKSNESFFELMENAETEGFEIISNIIDYWSKGNENKLDLIEKSIANISYDTGKDCTLPLKNEYCEPLI